METTAHSEHRTSRRSFLVKGAALGAGTLGAGLFIGQSPEFFTVLTGLAQAADAARHGS